MAEHHHQGGSSQRQGGFFGSRAGIVLVVFLVVIGFLLTTEHRAHALGAALWLLILACPLLHIFMHAGHEGHTNNTAGQDRQQIRKENAHEH